MEHLQSIGRGAKEDVKDRVNQVIQFYRDRKISQRETAKKFITDLMSDKKRSVTFAKKTFDKKYEQIEGRAPLNERMATNKNKQDYVVTFQLYGFDNGRKQGGQRGFKDNQGDWHNLLSMEQPIQMTLKNVRDEDKLALNLMDKCIVKDKFDNYLADLKRRLMLKKGQEGKITRKEFDKLNTREAWRKERGVDETLPKRRDTKGRYKEFEVIHKTDLFETLFNKLVKKNKELMTNYPNIEDYTFAIKIKDISDVTNTGGEGDETKKKLKDGNEVGIYHYTINTKINVNAEDFVRAIQDEEHTKGECWINILIDHYKDRLMSKNKWESKRLTREKVLKLMNVSEEDFKEHGVSVEEMKPVFEEFKLTVRLYNCIGQKVFAYDPEKNNKNVPTLYGLIKGNHIYTMNDNIVSICQIDIEEDLKPRASSDFQLNSREAPVKYEMFRGIDDIMEIVKNNEDQEELNLVSYKRLNDIYCEFKRAMYEPKIIMGAGGNITSIKLKFNGLVLNIRSQSLIGCAVDTCISSNDAEMFNKVNETFFNFNKGMFNPIHKSYYHEDDLNIFSKAYTIAPSGYLKTVGEE